MRGKQMDESDAVAAQEEQQLERQLQRDESGELRDRLFGELHGAALSIETVLAGHPEARQTRILRPLLEAINLSQRLILEAWNSLHRDAVRR
jgi:hypothetical protein